MVECSDGELYIDKLTTVIFVSSLNIKLFYLNLTTVIFNFPEGQDIIRLRADSSTKDADYCMCTSNSTKSGRFSHFYNVVLYWYFKFCSFC